MVRRSPPKKWLDEQAFPLRLRIDNPWSGTGSIRWTDAEVWLNDHVGSGDYARHGDGQRMLFFFRDADAAARFCSAFPDLRIADYTETVDHLNHQRRHGRAASAQKSEFVLPPGFVRYGDLK